MRYKVESHMRYNVNALMELHKWGAIYIPARKRKLLLTPIGRYMDDDTFHYYLALKMRFLNDWYVLDGKHIPRNASDEEKIAIQEWYVRQKGWTITQGAIKKVTLDNL